MGKNIARTYSAADFNRYHSGEMTAKDRYALEKAALSDPFLAEALEGYSTTTDFDHHLQSLKTKLAARIQETNKKRVLYIPKWTLKVAAACLVLALVGWLAYQLPLSGNSPVALDAKPLAEEKIADSNNSTVTVVDSLVVTTNVATSELFEKVKSSYKTQILKPKKSVTASTAEVSLPPASPEQPALESRVFADAVVSVPALALRTQKIEGSITDTTGRAIPFATIKVAQTGALHQSDAQGRFQLSTADTATIVTVSAVGYQNHQQLLNSERDNKLVLAEANASLQEVVVTGLGARRSRLKPQVTEGQLEPKEGWSRYNDYLSENLIPPDEAADKVMKGEVTLSFNVNTRGEPINIRVEKSLCESCNKKAIRLLKEGPKWKSGSKRRGTIAIRF